MCFKKRIRISEETDAIAFTRILDKYEVDYERHWNAIEGYVFKIGKQHI